MAELELKATEAPESSSQEILAAGINFLARLRSADALDESARKRAAEVHRDLAAASASRRLRLAVLGETSSGKSTFLNAMLGIDLLAADLRPTTAVATRLTWGPMFQVTARGRSCTTTLWEEVEPDRDFVRKLLLRQGQRFLDPGGALAPGLRSLVADFLRTHTTDEGGLDRAEGVTITLPSPFLAPAIDLFDTPGFNPGLPEADRTRHQDVTRRCVESSHLALFLIDGRNPLKRTEKAFLDAVRPYLSRVFFVVTKMDLLDDEEAKEARTYIQEELASRFEMDGQDLRIYFTSSRPSSPYFANIESLKHETLAYLQHSRKHVLLERATAVLAAETAAIRERASVLLAEQSTRLRNLRRLEITDVDSMRRGVLHDAHVAFEGSTQAAIECFDTEGERCVAFGIEAFRSEIAGAQDSRELEQRVRAAFEPIGTRYIGTPMGEAVIGCLLISLNAASKSMHQSFVRLYKDASVRPPAPPSLKSLEPLARGVIERLSGVGVANQMAGSRIGDNIIAGTGGVVAAGVAFMFLGPFGLVAGPIVGSVLKDLFGTPLDEQKQKAAAAFEAAARENISRKRAFVSLCLAGESVAFQQIMSDQVRTPMKEYEREVASLVARHRRDTLIVEARVAQLQQLSAAAEKCSARAAQSSALEKASLLRHDASARLVFEPLIDQETLDTVASRTAGAVLAGAEDVLRSVRELFQPSSMVHGQAGVAHSRALENASAALRLLRAVREKRSGDLAWCRSNAVALGRLRLSPLDVCLLLEMQPEVSNASSAVLAACAPHASIRRIASRLVALTPSSDPDAVVEGKAVVVARYAEWGLPLPAILGQSSERLGAAYHRRLRFRSIRRRGSLFVRRTVTALCAFLIGPALVLVYFAFPPTTRTSTPNAVPVATLQALVQRSPPPTSAPSTWGGAPPADVQPTPFPTELPTLSPPDSEGPSYAGSQEPIISSESQSRPESVTVAPFPSGGDQAESTQLRSERPLAPSSAAAVWQADGDRLARGGSLEPMVEPALAERTPLTEVPARTATPSASSPPTHEERLDPAFQAEVGWITVKANPWAEVWIDGKRVAEETPLRRYPLPAGAHRVRLVNVAGSLDAEREVIIISESETEVTADVATGGFRIR